MTEESGDAEPVPEALPLPEAEVHAETIAAANPERRAKRLEDEVRVSN